MFIRNFIGSPCCYRGINRFAPVGNELEVVHRHLLEKGLVLALPKTHVAVWFLAVLPGGETEPIAGRTIGVPEDLERLELRDGRSRFIEYVPPGSVDQGRQLATTGGNGKSAPCTICHGPELYGVDPSPASPDGRRATSCGNSMVFNTAREPVHGAR